MDAVALLLQSLNLFLKGLGGSLWEECRAFSRGEFALEEEVSQGLVNDTACSFSEVIDRHDHASVALSEARGC